MPGKQVTTIQALAANVNGDDIGLYITMGNPGWLVNGSQVTIPPGGYTLPQGGTIIPNGTNEWIVTWPSTAGVAAGTTLDAAAIVAPATPRVDLKAVTLGPGLTDAGLLGGALGNSDQDPRNDLTPFAGGTPVSPDCNTSTPAYQQPLYATFGNSWLVAGSLPGQPPGQPTSLFYQDTPSSWVVPDFPQTCTPKPVIKTTVAQKDCTTAGVPPFPESQDCLEDVAGTGSKTWTLSYPNAGHDCAVLTSGTLTTTSAKAKLSDCGDAANTAGAGTLAAKFKAGKGAASMTWANRKTTKFSFSITSPGQGGCVSGSAEYDVSGKVTADTTGSIPVGEAFSVSVCATTPGSLSFLPATVLTF